MTSKGNAFALKLMDQFRFWGGVIRSPQRLGAIAPTSAAVSDVIASHISSDAQLPVLELGPGTGPVTRAILRRGIAEKDIVAIEYDSAFYTNWTRQFPDATIMQGNALHIDEVLADDGAQKFDCVVSGIPMLNFREPAHEAFLQQAFARIAPGRPIIQITYGPKSPIIVKDASVEVEASPWILRNLPPAKIWTYRRP